MQATLGDINKIKDILYSKQQFTCGMCVGGGSKKEKQDKEHLFWKGVGIIPTLRSHYHQQENLIFFLLNKIQK